jgi:gamma-D-glutamyl-L-lysine dipeptidyl-peptidase
MARFVVAFNVANLYTSPAALQQNPDTQALMNEEVTILQEQGDWCRVRLRSDLHEAWILREKLVEVADPTDRLTVVVVRKFAPVRDRPASHGKIHTTLAMGTVVTVQNWNPIGSYAEVQLPGQPETFHLSKGRVQYVMRPGGRPRVHTTEDIAEMAVTTGRRFTGFPHLPGGCTPWGYDCSGFVQACYKLRLQLPRTANGQFNDRRFQPVEVGVPLLEAHLQFGDLIGFGENGLVTEIGLAVSYGFFLHCNAQGMGDGGVYESELDDPRFKPRYLGARRLTNVAGIEAA